VHPHLCSRLRIAKQRPYGKKNNKAVKEFLGTGGRMTQPKNANPRAFGVIMSCWQRDPALRPQAIGLARTLAEMLPYCP
jgi:hypothetical protein